MPETSPPATGDGLFVRHAEPADYPPIIAVIDDWWGGRAMQDMLPKLFFEHFRATSFVACERQRIVGFVIGFASQSFPEQAYIHFVGIDPAYRQRGIGRLLYERFFAAAQTLGRSTVRCVTSPLNRDSIAFHRRLGFAVETAADVVDGVPVARDYDGPGGDRVLFNRRM